MPSQTILTRPFVKKNIVYVVGSFENYKGQSNLGIIRLNPDGTKDTTFNNSNAFTGGGGIVSDATMDSEGRIYAGGGFTAYKGVTANRIIRLNPDGSKDETFDNSTGFNASVTGILLTSDNKLYVVGSFTTYKGVAAECIARLNLDGSRDTTFDGSFNSFVNTILPTTDGKFYVGGSFTSYKETAFDNYLIRINADGTNDESFNNAAFSGGVVETLALDSDGKLYVGGAFTSYNNITENRIIRLNPDGSKDTGFDNSLGGFDDTVQTIKIDSNGKIYVGGAFSNYKSVQANRIIRLNTDGSKDTSFDNSTGFDNIVYNIELTSDEKLYVGGTFTSYKGVTANRIIKLNADGTKDTSFDNSTGFDFSARTILDTFAPIGSKITLGVGQNKVIITP